MPKRWKGRPGQELVEYALLAPIMLLGLVVFFDLSRFVYTYTVLSNAAREGARYASIVDSSQEAQIDTYIFSRVPGLDAGNVLTAYTWVDCTTDTYFKGTELKEINLPATVTVQLDYTIDGILVGSLPSQAESTMRLENCLP